MELVIKTIALDLLAGLQLEEASVRVERKQQEEESELEHYFVEVTTTDAPLLIGRRGETLNAFQHILKMIANKKARELNRRLTLVVDVDGYRKRQELEAVDLALRRAAQVRSTGNPIKLPPMSAYERRLVHVELLKPEWNDLMTESVGERDYRAVVIRKK